MSVTVEMVKAYFDSIGYKYKEVDPGKAIHLLYGGTDHISEVNIILVFSDDRYVTLKSYHLCQIPEEKKEKMYELCSDLNAQYRWVKFYVDEKDNTLTAQDDAILDPDSAGEEIRGLAGRMAGIIDDAYPTIMKTLWV